MARLPTETTGMRSIGQHTHMKATKVTVCIEVEALSVDCLRGLADRAIEHVEREFEAGELRADDGDVVRWNVTRKPVEF
jgi:hypothetical protein